MDIIVECPHCKGTVVVAKKQVKCGVFRHGVYINTGRPIHAHMPKKKCEELYASKKILGCGKPFRLEKDDGKNEKDGKDEKDKKDKYKAVECDYLN
jgi:hypothetical protein